MEGIDLLKYAKINIRGILMSSQGGRMYIKELEHNYRAEIGSEIPYRKLGFQELFLFLCSLKDLVVVTGFGSSAIVEAIIIESLQDFGKLKKQISKTNYDGMCLGNNNDKSRTVLPNSSISSSDAEYENESSVLNHPGTSRDYISNPEYKTEITEQMNQLILKNRNGKVPECKSLTTSIMKPMEFLILEAVNPHRFWFTEPSNQHELQELKRNMKEFYDNLSENNLRYEPKELIKELYVAVKYNEIWHRAKVVSINHLDAVRVYYIDNGTVDDVSDICHIRYLMPQYMDLPAVAQRGVLSNIQPKGGIWNKEAVKYFTKNFTNKTLPGIIFKINSTDSSYYVALKSQNKLVTMLLMELNYGFIDSDFLKKDEINRKELKFSDYESGVHKPGSFIDVENGKTTPDGNEQLPANSSESTSSQLFNFYKKYSSNILFNFDTKEESSDDKLSKEAEIVPREEKTLQQEILAPVFSSLDLLRRLHKSLSRLVDYDPIKEVSAQDYSKYNLKKKYNISICVIYSLAKFYFYFKDDLDTIRKYLDDFNADYKINSLKNQVIDGKLKEGDNVVVKVAENFCRGKILELLNDETFKIFLFDFGGYEVMRKEDIYMMKEEYFQHPPCAYLGKLANIPLTIDPVDLRQCFEDEVRDRFHEAQIIKIQEKSFELIIYVPNDEETINDKLCAYDY